MPSVHTSKRPFKLDKSCYGLETSGDFIITRFNTCNTITNQLTNGKHSRRDVGPPARPPPRPVIIIIILIIIAHHSLP